MVWKPAKALGLATGLVILLTLLCINILLLQGMGRQDIGAGLYLTVLIFILSLAALGVWGYWYYDLVTLRYYLDRNALVIACGASRQVVPIDAIQRILPGNEVEIIQGIRGLGWPGYVKGRSEAAGLGQLMIHSTEPVERQLIVVTDQQCYGISPRDPQRFLADYAMRRALGPISELDQELRCSPLVAWPVWRDWGFWSMCILAFVANIVLFGFIVNQYAALPDRMPLHYNVSGQADRIAAKAWLFVIPAIGALALGVNTVLGLVLHRRERLGAYLFAGMACGVQAILWVATLGILNR
jgi:hypothetical protein